MTNKDENYLREKEQYLLRSIYVRRKIRTNNCYDVFRSVKDLAENSSEYDRGDRSCWGISDKAWLNVEQAKLNPLLTFCHPEVLKTNPRFLLYYRSVALLPQKGFQTIIKKDPAPYENGTKTAENISHEECQTISSGLNEIISNTLEQGSSVTIEEITGMFFAQTGTTIDGSWRNEIGRGGQQAVWRIIAQALSEKNEIKSVKKRARGKEIPAGELKLNGPESWRDYRSLILTNGAKIEYSSDPDVLLRNSQGDLLGAIEVKAGLDKAGALERAGAIKNTFDPVHKEYPRAKFILVTSCKTESMNETINHLDYHVITYETERLTAEESQQRKFINHIRNLLGLEH